MKKTHSRKLSIPCFFEEPKPKSSIKPSNRPCTKFSTSKNSPNSSYVSKIKVVPGQVKSSSRQLSPRPLVSCNNSPPRGVKAKVPSHIIKKKKKPGKKTSKVVEKLSILSGSNLKFAPKLFENQLFLDVYDEFGRHDRFMEIQESLQSDRSTPIVVFNNLIVTDVECEGPKPPGNSFEETCQDSGNILRGKVCFDLFARLEQVAKNQNSLEVST
jgi:hypothetical protein